MSPKAVLAFILLLCFSFPGISQNNIVADKGVMDLSDWDVQKEPYLRLTGKWEFYWKRMIAPWDYSSADSADVEFQDCNDNWNSYEHEGVKLPAFGFATYRLNIRNLPDQELNFMIRSVTCATTVYIDDDLVAEVGTTGTKEELEEPRYEELIVPLPRDKSDFTITIFLSNFQHRNGGFNDPWYIGTEAALYNIHRKHIMLNGIESSTFLFAGLFFITLYIFRRKDKALLYFALYALTFCIRPLVSVNYMIMTIWPDIDWNLLIHIEYLSLFLPGGFLLLFIRERFKEQAPQKLLLILALLSFAEAFITIILPPHIFTWLPLPHQLISFVSFGVLLYVVIRAMKERVSGAIFATVAILCIILSSAYMIFLYLDVIPPAPYSYAALQMTFLLSMTMILGSKFASQFRKVEYLMVETAEQKEQLQIQNELVEQKNEEITSSITYARRIQKAILPPDDLLTELLPDSFILYKPKDIVAGDFYWAEKEGDLLFIAAADCTGHGVPGAMVSVVCNAALNRSIREFELNDPAKILDKTRDIVVESFNQSDEEVKDGMDISLCTLNLKTKELKFAGANNPLWIIRQQGEESLIDTSAAKVFDADGMQLIEVKGDKQPVGVHFDPKPFKSHSFQMSAGESVYLFSDGYPDQFGGDKGKKFMYKAFKSKLLSICSKPFQSQEKDLDRTIENWKDGMEQTDDICVIGFKI